VVARVLAREPSLDLRYSVSVSTREPRPGEQEAQDYWFVSDEQFDEHVRRGDFLEWAKVFGHRYGTLATPIEKWRDEGLDVLLEIDVQGARKVRERVPDALLVFLVPPSWDELARRLRDRGTEDDEALERRLAGALEEMDQADWFDHVLVNDDLERATDEVAAIIEQHRRGEAPGERNP